ncbi:MAG TPA: IclR family transcriptional regulator [Candidatus Aminicenantes bacterium]|nr:IclR family transcriptional regulator [Candidatus Aminicenantes bacterium]
MSAENRGAGKKARPQAKRGPDGAHNIYFSKIIDRGLNILDLFRPETTSLSLKEIAEATGINRTSSFRFVDTLVQLGYLRKDPRLKLIKLGPKALMLGQNIINSFDILQVVQPLIDGAFRKHNVTIDSAILDDVRFVRLYRREARDTLTFKLPQVLPAARVHCIALSKACLSVMDEEDLARATAEVSFKKRMPGAVANMAGLHRELELTRARGYSINNEEYVAGIISVGAPFFGADGKVLGAVSFDVVSIRLSKEDVEKRFAAAAVELARAITSSLG